MPSTNKREPKTKSDKVHQEMAAHIKNLPKEIPGEFLPGYVSLEYIVYLEDLFNRHGFHTEREERPAPRHETEIIVSVDRQGIRGAFGNEHARSLYYEERFVAGNAQCFDKYSNCPLVIKLPMTIRREAEMLEYLRLLAKDQTEEAYDYPRELDLRSGNNYQF